MVPENKTTINIHDIAIDKALAELKAITGELPDGKTVDKLFEEHYNCTIVSLDDYGINGYVYFPEEKHETYFMLKFGQYIEGDKKCELPEL